MTRPKSGCGLWSSWWSTGSPNAAVLPEPVSARPIMSRPCRAHGIASTWRCGRERERERERVVMWDASGVSRYGKNSCLCHAGDMWARAHGGGSLQPESAWAPCSPSAGRLRRGLDRGREIQRWEEAPWRNHPRPRQGAPTAHPRPHPRRKTCCALDASRDKAERGLLEKLAKIKNTDLCICVDALVGGGCLIQVPQRPPRVLAGVPAVFAPPRQR